MIKVGRSVSRVRMIYVITTVFMVGLSIYSFLQINNLFESANMIYHTNQVKDALGKISTTLLDAETNKRGYLLTGDSLLILKRDFALHKLSEAQKILDSLILENPEQRRQVTFLYQAIAEKILSIKATSDKGLPIAMTGNLKANIVEGIRSMDKVNLYLEEIMSQETSLLELRTQRFTRLSLIAPLYIIVLFLGALLILFYSYFKLNSELVKSHGLHAALVLQGEDREVLGDELMIANKELAFQNEEKEKRAAELMIANKELAFQNEEKEKRASELAIANKELAFQNDEKEKRATELMIANKELAFQNEEKEKRAFELAIANKELAFQNEEKEKRAAELIIANYARSLIEASLDPLVTISADGKITDVNAASIKVTGVSREKLIGTDFSNYFTEPKKAKEGYLQVFEKGFVSDYPLTIKHKDGNLTDVLYNASVYKDGKGNVLGVFAAARDVTEQKQASQYARSLIEANLDPLVTISADGKITDVNAASIKVTGIPREKLIGTDFSNYFTEPKKAKEGYLKVFEKGFVSDYPLTIKHKDGNLTDVLYNATVYKDSKGNVLGVFAAARDVTEQKQASQYARSLIEANLDPLVTISADGKITDVNAATIKVTGIPREKLIGTDFSNYFTEPKKAQEGYLQVFEKSFVSDYPLTIKHKDGNLTDVLYNASVYKDSKGKILGVFAAARDVTEQKWAKDLRVANTELAFQNEEKEKRASELAIANKELAFQNEEKEKRATELLIANEELAFQNEEKEKRASELVIANIELAFQNQLKEKRAAELVAANKELQLFLNISSHDLQEPLRKIQMAASRIESSDYMALSPKGRVHFVKMQEAALSMQTLIEDLLTYSRTNSEERKFENIDLGIIINEVRHDLKESIEEKSAVIEVKEICQANIIRFQFRQLLHNIISNALKFSIPGKPPHIQISANLKPGHDCQNDRLNQDMEYCHIRISDNGIGFEPIYREKIFEVFQRLYGKETYKGTGIGLAIVKRIVENHDGCITANGELNKGATFDIYIPTIKKPQHG